MIYRRITQGPSWLSICENNNVDPFGEFRLFYAKGSRDVIAMHVSGKFLTNGNYIKSYHYTFFSKLFEKVNKR